MFEREQKDRVQGFEASLQNTGRDPRRLGCLGPLALIAIIAIASGVTYCNDQERIKEMERSYPRLK